ncbi:GNAT family N-acetyltransferase [bacterium]|nr:GNAT family N-acetyltransferase [bacterium]
MTKQVIIRKGTLQDVAVITEFNKRMAKETENKLLDEKRVLAGALNLVKNPEYGFYLVAEKQGEIMAALMITTEWSDWRDGNFWWIQSVYVRSEFRRQGVFSLLYQTVSDLAKQQGDVCGIRLYVEQNNSVAQRTYESLGMKDAHYKVYEMEMVK